MKTKYFPLQNALIAFLLLVSVSLITGCAAMSKMQRRESKDARACMGAIYNAVKFYRQDYSCDPSSVEELIEKDYLALDKTSAKRWSFHFIGSNPIVMIEAESTTEMPGGAGHIIIFDVQTGEFLGYGCED